MQMMRRGIYKVKKIYFYHFIPVILREEGGETYADPLVGFSNSSAQLWYSSSKAVHPTQSVSHRPMAVLLPAEGMIVSVGYCKKCLHYEYRVNILKRKVREI